MYHAIVRRKVRHVFEAVSRGDAEPVFTMFAGRFEHVFLGEDHALGGTRTSMGQLRAWYGRLYRLMPDISFALLRISVSGPPWNTLIVADWCETNGGTDGIKASAAGYHMVELRWGRATRMVIAPDTRVLAATLQRLASKGVAEAAAAPITG